MRKLLLLCAPAALAFFYVTAPAARTSQTATAQQGAAQVPRDDARRLSGRVTAVDAAKKQIVVETRARGDFEAVTLDASGLSLGDHYGDLTVTDATTGEYQRYAVKLTVQSP